MDDGSSHLTTLLYIIPVLVISKTCYFDRYFLFMMPLLMAVICSTASTERMSRGWLAGALVVIVLFGGFAVAGTHDYFAWNRARWKAYLDLVQVDKIPPTQVNGGYECNGWTCFHGNADMDVHIQPFYVITLGPLDSFEVIRAYRVKTWLPYANQDILVLRYLH